MPFLPAHRPTQRYAGPAWTKSSHLTGNRPMQRKARRDVKPIRSKAHLLHKPATKLRFVPSKTKQNKTNCASYFSKLRRRHSEASGWRIASRTEWTHGARMQSSCSSVARERTRRVAAWRAVSVLGEGSPSPDRDVRRSAAHACPPAAPRGQEGGHGRTARRTATTTRADKSRAGHARNRVSCALAAMPRSVRIDDCPHVPIDRAALKMLDRPLRVARRLHTYTRAHSTAPAGLRVAEHVRGDTVTGPYAPSTRCCHVRRDGPVNALMMKNGCARRRGATDCC